VNSSESSSSIFAPRERNPVPSSDRARSNADPTPTSPAIEVELSPPGVAGYAAIVSLNGEHDLAMSDELVATLAPIDGNLLIDLSACEFIDSTVIGAVIAKSIELARAGSRLELIVPAANGVVTRVIDIVGLRTLMTVHDQLPSATPA
jgi:anti-anti-sigma factor